MTERSTEWQPNERIHLWKKVKHWASNIAELNAPRALAGRWDCWSGCGANERCHSIDSESENQFMQIKRNKDWIKFQLIHLFPATNYFRIWFGHEADHSIYFFCLVSFHQFFFSLLSFIRRSTSCDLFIYTWNGSYQYKVRAVVDRLSHTWLRNVCKK